MALRSCRSGLLIAAKSRAQKPKKRQATRNGQKQNLFDDGGAVLRSLAVLLGLRLHLELEHHGVLGEIHAALLAFSAHLLHVLTGGADVTQRGVTAEAELRCLGILVPALSAFHSPLYPLFRCAHTQRLDLYELDPAAW
jgi:hypothetical protein